MNKTIKAALIFSFSLAIAIIHCAPALAQNTAGQVLASLSKLPADKRQQVLVEKAKAEGEVTFYSSLQAQQLEPFVKVFATRYPFIKANPYRISGGQQVARIQTEMQAGRNLVDVTNGAAEQASNLKSIGALDPYFSPQREFYSEAYRDQKGYFSAFYIIPMVLGYNTTMVKRNEAPKSYQDLLDPKWHGKIFLDDEAYEWFAVMLKSLGREKGLKYMKELAKQDIRFTRGRTLQTQLIVAGERPLGIVLSGHTVLDLKSKGAPIDWVALDPYFSHSNQIMLARHAPHPYAAALFIDWSLSEEGQTKITTFGRVVARKGIKQRFPELVEKESFLVDVDFITPILDETGKEFRTILLGR
jgi:iron(III) transport system substrate-binding protein